MIQADKQKKMSTKPNIHQYWGWLKEDSPRGLLAHLLLVGGGAAILFILFFWVYLPLKTNHQLFTGKDMTVTVPDLSGKSLEEAQLLLEQAGLRYEIFDSSATNYTVNFPAGAVIAQTPAAEALVKEGRKVYLTINPARPPLVELPRDLLDKSLQHARLKLQDVGLVLDEGSIERVPWPSDRVLCENCADIVLGVKYKGQEIPGYLMQSGFKVYKGAKVVLVVSDGLGGAEIDLPNLVGLSLEEAQVLLSGLGLGVGNLYQTQTDTVPAGQVVMQAPAQEGDVPAKIRTGKTVDVWISAPIEE